MIRCMTSEKEKMLNRRLYDAADPELVDEREHARDLTKRYNRTTIHNQSERGE